MEKKPSLSIPELGLEGYECDLTDDEILEKSYTKYKNDWLVSNDLTKNKPIIFTGQQTPKEFILETNVLKYISYCYYKFENLREFKTLSEYENRGGMCIYLTTLLYWLIWSTGVSENDLKLCQGIYKHKLREDVPELYRQIFAEDLAGMHCWLEYKGLILDVAIAQERDFFKFENSNGIIIGKVPEGMKLYGFREDKSLAKEYARQIAKFEGLSFYDWLEKEKNLEG